MNASGRTARVIAAKVDAEGSETMVEIKVLLTYDHLIHRAPAFADVPAEVRGALLEWMGAFE